MSSRFEHQLARLAGSAIGPATLRIGSGRSSQPTGSAICLLASSSRQVRRCLTCHRCLHRECGCWVRGGRNRDHDHRCKGKHAAQQGQGIDEVSQCRLLIACELVDDIATLDVTLASSKKRIAAAVAASGTSLYDIDGVGPIGAATIIGYVGDVTRFGTKAQFASYNGTAPMEMFSGGRTRQRLNLRGNRTLNFAIHIAAVTQFRNPSEGRIFYDRKIGEGKTLWGPTLGRGVDQALQSIKRLLCGRSVSTDLFRRLLGLSLLFGGLGGGSLASAPTLVFTCHDGLSPAEQERPRQYEASVSHASILARRRGSGQPRNLNPELRARGQPGQRSEHCFGTEHL